MEDVMKNVEKFQNKTRVVISNFNLDYVINTNQTGCQYKTTYYRTLANTGIKTVLEIKNHKSGNSYIYGLLFINSARNYIYN